VESAPIELDQRDYCSPTSQLCMLARRQKVIYNAQ
jgi:hypothetical protein